MVTFTPTQIELSGGRAFFRPSGLASLHGAVSLVKDAINHVRDEQIDELLVNLRGLNGFRSPSVGERYFFIQQWGIAARGRVCVAVVARAELIDPNKFGVLVAANRGFDADIFESEGDAIAWLNSRR